MYRFALFVMIPLLLTSTAVHAANPWPKTYTFYGR